MSSAIFRMKKFISCSNLVLQTEFAPGHRVIYVDMNIKSVCRLCSSNSENNKRFCVFSYYVGNKRKSVRDIISKIIGIEINKEDPISQKICTSCGKHLVQLYKFREKSLKNDRFLRELQKKTAEKNIIHNSVVQLFKTYPYLKLPYDSLNLDFSPIVEMDLNEVENYFESKNIRSKNHIRRVMEDKKIKEAVSPINIKFRLDKSAYEIFRKPLYYTVDDEGKLQNEIIDLISSSPSINNRKRKIDDDINIYLQNEKIDSKKFQSIDNSNITPNVISNLTLKENINKNILNVEHNQDKTFSYPPVKQFIKPQNEPTFSCHFCRNTFETKTFTIHYKACAINNMPDVLVDKLENNKTAETMYRRAISNLIEPVIEITNSTYFNINYEIETRQLIRQLLTIDKNLRPAERDTQTDLKPNETDLESINTEHGITSSVILKNFKPYLDLYKIPVSINIGNELSVKYSYKDPPETIRKFKDWNNLTPIDVKITKETKELKQSQEAGLLENLDTIKKLLDSVDTSATMHDNVAESHSSTENIVSTNINLNVPSFGLRYELEQNHDYIVKPQNIQFPSYSPCIKENFCDYRNYNNSLNCLPSGYTNESQNGMLYDQHFDKYPNVTSNVNNQIPIRNSNKIWYPPLPSHNFIPSIETKQTVYQLNPDRMQPVIQRIRNDNYHLNSAQSNMYSGSSNNTYYNNYQQNANRGYSVNNNGSGKIVTQMHYRDAQYSRHNLNQNCINNNSSGIRVRPISDLK
ncbi:putative uncharacterized protein DDB_G0282133 isoform X1 [Diorhabda sublineata]|uniref:putative uncharacterized protein DDB_G0282133 isoform X1 n=1 Tax=Diorhabda sublineata TaxID=1163346 RepID=UPI0024E14F10|nr:putative uncharacterized protein DDB_G0282133 isoform X1 [Diorhabda sublineata]